MSEQDIRIFPYTIAAFISCCACLWVFYRFLTQIKKTIGFSLILVLAMSDFLYSTNIILNNFFPSLKIFGVYVYIPVFFFSIFFSIMWCSVISLLVYKSLANNSHDMTKLFVKTLITVFLISLFFTIIQSTLEKVTYQRFYIWFGPLACSLMATLIFYQKSINLLQRQSQFELKSTNIYIKNLRWFSLAQIFTYGPLVIYYCILGMTNLYIDLKYQAWIEITCSCLASLSGFISIVLFLSMKGMDHQEPSVDTSMNDLTIEIM